MNSLPHSAESSRTAPNEKPRSYWTPTNSCSGPTNLTNARSISAESACFGLSGQNNPTRLRLLGKRLPFSDFGKVADRVIVDRISGLQVATFSCLGVRTLVLAFEILS